LIADHKFFLLILLLFFFLAIIYNITLPVGESDHEASHYRYIRYVKNHWHRPPSDYVWPVVAEENDCPSTNDTLEKPSGEWQFTQPPLYYFLTASIFSWYHNDESWWPARNPFTTLAGLKPGGGANVLVHTPDETIASHPTVLEIHLYRFFSTVLGAIGLLGVYFIGLLLFGGDKTMASLLSGGVAFIPMYIAASSAVNNDILVGVLGIWSIYFFAKSLDSRQCLIWNLLGIFLLILVAFTKFTFFIFFPVLTATFLLIVIFIVRARKFNRTVRRLLLLAIIDVMVLIIAPLWFFNRNVDSALTKRYVFLQFPLRTLLTYPLESSGNLFAQIKSGIVFSFHSYWGLLGAESIHLPDWMLFTLLGFSMLAAIGVIRIFFKRQYDRKLKIAILLSIGILVIDWMTIFLLSKHGARGRYILALYPLISLLFITGTSVFRFRKYGPIVTYLYLAVLFLIASIVPIVVINPHFSPPPTLSTYTVQPDDAPVHARFGDLAEIISIRIEPQNVTPGDIATVTLVWHVLKNTENNYTIGVHAEDGNHRFIAGVTHFPANGRYATSLWQPGDVFEDVYQIQMPFHMSPKLPTGGFVKVTMYRSCPDGDHYLLVKDAQGNQIGDAVYSPPIRIGFPVTAKPVEKTDVLGNFGNELVLTDIQGLPDRIEDATQFSLKLTWQALKRPAHDYSVSIQVIDENKTALAGIDIPFTNGYYPSHLWLPNEIVEHEHPVTIPQLPTGDYRLILSVYDGITRTPLILGLDSERFTPEGYLLMSWKHLDTTHASCIYADSEWHCLDYEPLIIYKRGQTELTAGSGNNHVGE